MERQELVAAEAKLERALANKDTPVDPVSGFAVNQIVEWLAQTDEGRDVLQKRGYSPSLAFVNCPSCTDEQLTLVGVPLQHKYWQRGCK